MQQHNMQPRALTCLPFPSLSLSLSLPPPSPSLGGHSLRRGPSVSCADSTGYTPLHFAALNGNYEVCQYLLKMEANANARDQKGSSPLHLAAWGGHTQVAQLLLTGKSQNTRAAVNCKAMNGETPLHSAAQHGNAECLVSTTDEWQRTWGGICVFWVGDVCLGIRVWGTGWGEGVYLGTHVWGMYVEVGADT